MSFKIILSSTAKKDIEDSYDWYEKELIGLGIRFLSTIGNALNVISVNPEAFTKQKNGLRQKPVSEFPFLIIYKIKGKETISIIRIFHTSRNPKLKYKRK